MGLGLFEDPLPASLYDDFNSWSACDDFYLELARSKAGSVLDLGCGTGMLACRIASEGREVTGVDPSEAMLRVARSRAGGESVCWVQASGQDMLLVRRFDLVYMTGHAFQALLTDEAAIGLLRAVREHLTKDGRFVFETRNPARRAWLDWRGRSRIIETAEHGRIEESCEAFFDERTGIVELAHRYRFLNTGRIVTGHSHLRFVDQAHVERLLAAGGLRAKAWYGDWDRTAVTEGSPEIIVVSMAA